MGPDDPRDEWSPRYYELGIQPVLQTFNSPVPAALRSVQLLGSWAQILLALVVAARAGTVVALVGGINVLHRIEAGEANNLVADAAASDRAVHLWGLTGSLAYLAAAVVFLLWFWRVRFNAGVWAPRSQRRTQGCAFWGWVCPIVNFWFPYSIASDALAASAPAGSTGCKGSRLLRLWWMEWLIQGLFAVTAAVMARRASSPSALAGATSFQIGADVLLMFAGVLAILVVRNLTSLQEHKIAAQLLA